MPRKRKFVRVLEHLVTVILTALPVYRELRVELPGAGQTAVELHAVGISWLDIHRFIPAAGVNLVILAAAIVWAISRVRRKARA